MEIYIRLPGRKEQEIEVSIDRLNYGPPTEDEWKPVVLYLSGSFKMHQGFLDLASPFDLSFMNGGQEFARVKNGAVLELNVVDNLETIHIQISGRIRMTNLLELETPK